KRAPRAEYSPRAPRDGDERSARPPRPYRKPEADSRSARQGDYRGAARRDDRAPREMRDGDDRSARPARAYQKSRDSSSATRGGARGASPRSPYSRSSDTRAPAPLTPEQRQRQAAGEHARDKGWGGVARKGAVNITSTGPELSDA